MARFAIPPLPGTGGAGGTLNRVVRTVSLGGRTGVRSVTGTLTGATRPSVLSGSIVPGRIATAASPARGIQTVNSSTTGFVRQTQGTRQVSTHNRLSKLGKIMEIISKIICGLVILIAVINILIGAFDLGKDNLKFAGYGALQQNTKIGTFRTILKSFDIIRFLSKAGGALLPDDKMKVVQESYKRGWLANKKGPVPDGLDEKTLAEMWKKGELKTRSEITNSGRASTSPSGQVVSTAFIKAGASAGGFCELDLNKTIGRDFEYLKDAVTIDPNSRFRALPERDIGTITTGENTFAAFFGIRGTSSGEKVCTTCENKPCGNVHINAHHPLDICLGRAKYNIEGMDNCDKFMCKDYRYVMAFNMKNMPSWADKMSMEDLSRFIQEHVSKNGTDLLVWPNPPKKIDFYYNDNGHDRRWDLKFSTAGGSLPFTPSQGTASEGEDISNTSWKGGSGDGDGRVGFCCDPYSDNDTLAGIKALNKTTVEVEGISTVPINKKELLDFETSGGPNNTGIINENAGGGLLWTMALIAPQFREVKVAKFDSFSTDDPRNTRDYKKAKEFIDKLHEKNTALRKEIKDWDDDFYIPVNENLLGGRGSSFGSGFTKFDEYRGYNILKDSGKDFAVVYSELAKPCACSREGIYAANTEASDIDGEFVVGATYEITVSRFSRTVCNRGDENEWKVDAKDNKCTFVVNCGDEGAPPGGGTLDISYGYNYVGGYIN